MKKILLATLFLAGLFAKAQYQEIDVRLKILEERRGIAKGLKNINLDNKKFVLRKDFDDHIENLIITINGTSVTFVEVFTDKSNDENSSNVFRGDVVRTKDNFLSFRFDTLEGEKIAVPITKNLLITKQHDILYLIDVNTSERWIDQQKISKGKENRDKRTSTKRQSKS